MKNHWLVRNLWSLSLLVLFVSAIGGCSVWISNIGNERKQEKFAEKKKLIGIIKEYESSHEGINFDYIRFTKEVEDAISSNSVLYSRNYDIQDLFNIQGGENVCGTDQVKEYYEAALVPRGILSSVEEFREVVASPHRRKDFYETVLRPERDFKSYDEFERVLGLKTGIAIMYVTFEFKWCVRAYDTAAEQITSSDYVYFKPCKIWYPNEPGRPTYIHDDSSVVVECLLTKTGRINIDPEDREEYRLNEIFPPHHITQEDYIP